MKKFKKIIEKIMFLVILLVLAYVSAGMIFINVLAMNYGVFIGILAMIVSVFSWVILIKLLTE